MRWLFDVREIMMINEVDIQTHKQTAIEFLKLVVSGQIDEAYQRYVNMQGKHHNPFFPAGFTSLQQAMVENHTQFPKKQLTVKNVLIDGDFAAVHSHLTLKPGEKGMIVVHIFRFSGNKIVEFWDCGQAIPLDSPNKDGAF
jgi:predicted SnoaL-like aldol condensation-catalyzing enzyme